MNTIWPDFPHLLATAWTRFLFNWKHIIALSLLASVLYTVVAFLAVMIFITSYNSYSLSTGFAFALVGCIAIIVAIAMTYISATTMLILAESERIQVIPTFRMSLKLLPSFILVACLTAFLTLGSFGLLVIPGFVVGCLFSYSLFEYVFFDVKKIDALVSSAQIFSQNWRQIFINHLPLFVLLLGYSLLMSTIQRALFLLGLPVAVFSLLKIFGSALFGAFSLNLSFVLYMTARMHTDRSRSVPMIPIVGVAVLGWIVIIFVYIPNFLRSKLREPQSLSPRFPIETIAPYRPTTPYQFKP